MSGKNILVNKSFNFAVSIVGLYKEIAGTEKEFVLSKQMLRSGTSVGALVREAQNAESRADFIHKLSIAQKECDETVYWLDLLKITNYISTEKFEALKLEAQELLKIIRSIILTTKNKAYHNS